ncbi:hypothetical protein KRMM14A1259_73070 [Krasilnikovia sp. MM14-A1259]
MGAVLELPYAAFGAPIGTRRSCGAVRRMRQAGRARRPAARPQDFRGLDTNRRGDGDDEGRDQDPALPRTAHYQGDVHPTAPSPR